ncbi:AIR synthase related protein [Nonomuraea lactucae]|uniref:AIR synthase related protein n=1 Tax=Nonomuraea lactucae TaxID=2249762 RepID=UPI000DE1F4CC|nr:AIR synthase related protein [Nonomuraea lactucae]
MAELDDVIAAVASSPAIQAKRSIGLVSEVLGASGWVDGPGDDGAAVDVGGRTVIACGEALWPQFVRADPFGAGVAAVLTNVNDVAAMGGLPLGIVDTVVADEATARTALEGMRYASGLYDVPIVGGHITVCSGVPPSISAFALGSADALLSSTHVRAGQALVVAACTEGTMRDDFPFFPSFDERGQDLAEDVRLLADVARKGLAVAAKDISMAGLVGSLAMLLEWGTFGADVSLEALPAPRSVPRAWWCTCFPCYGFLLTCEPDRTDACVRAFTSRGLSAARVGGVDGTGVITLSAGGRSLPAFDLTAERVTGLTRAPHTPGRETATGDRRPTTARSGAGGSIH